MSAAGVAKERAELLEAIDTIYAWVESTPTSVPFPQEAADRINAYAEWVCAIARITRALRDAPNVAAAAARRPRLYRSLALGPVTIPEREATS